MYCLRGMSDIFFGRLQDNLWNTSRHFSYLVSVERTVGSVSKKMAGLADRREEVRRRAEIARNEGMLQVTSTVTGWLDRVDAVQATVAAVEADFRLQDAKVFPASCSPEQLWCRYHLGKRAAEALSEVAELMAGGDFATVAEPPPAEVSEVDIPTNIVGSNFNFLLKKLRGFLADDDVSTVGIYGPGGVGKTTLVAKLNNELLISSRDDDDVRGGFSKVAFVVVSNRTKRPDDSDEPVAADAAAVDTTVDRIQMAIGERFQLPMTENEGRSSRAKKISTSFAGKSYVLFLDDVWKDFNLGEVGIPLPDGQNKRKVFLTTRYEWVCNRVVKSSGSDDIRGGLRTVEVRCLDEEDACELFRRSVGRGLTENREEEVSDIARRIAGDCKGLPLALIIVGRALASEMTVEEWRYAVKTLNRKPAIYEDGLLSRLKFSYDNLPDDTLRICFLYCSMFPEDYCMKKEKLVQYWIGEGLLEEFLEYSLQEARLRGHHLMAKLRDACLLEAGWNETEVKMHDVVRDLALWIASDGGKRKDRFLVHGGVGKNAIAGKWGAAERVSLIKNKRIELPRDPDCPDLMTLLLTENVWICQFPGEFFRLMPSLVVLDLSFTRIEEFPAGIGRLARLRYLNLAFTAISSLPAEIGRLIGLRYLNLAFTAISSLPAEIGDLTNLRRLDLSDTKSLHTVPARAITRLSKLQALDMYATGYGHWRSGGGGGDDGNGDRPLALGDLECLQVLDELGLTVRNVSSFRTLSRAQKWLKITRRLHLEGSWDRLRRDDENLQVLRELTIPVRDSGPLSILEGLNLVGLFDMERISMTGANPDAVLSNLRVLEISYNRMLRDLTWILELPHLEEIKLLRCVGMEEMVEEESVAVAEERGVCFHHLKFISLDRVRSLRSIIAGGRSLEFPSLETLLVFGCPKLKRLPFDRRSARNLRVVRGERAWWEELKWDHADTQSTFSSYFIEW